MRLQRVSLSKARVAVRAPMPPAKKSKYLHVEYAKFVCSHRPESHATQMPSAAPVLLMHSSHVQCEVSFLTEPLTTYFTYVVLFAQVHGGIVARQFVFRFENLQCQSTPLTRAQITDCLTSYLSTARPIASVNRSDCSSSSLHWCRCLRPWYKSPTL